MFVRTERLFLRPGWPEDLEDLLEVFEDDDVQQDAFVAPLPRTAGEVREFLERPRDPRLPHFVMYLRSAKGAELVGGIGFAREGDRIEMGYWIVPRFRGRGYAAEAVRAVLNQARTLGYRKVYANHFVDSSAPAKALESAGFHDTGRVHSRYSAGLGMETTARIYVAELERRTSPRIEPTLASL
ncbi:MULTISPECIES: GNAT family N-acetyltransferase [Novosphingobium]|uniref:Protein N-acetyltransferase, RimJ/RimL family n=1 Tax=Novosphingobium mathurense TaxID=428990 RepID=A0A1U6IGB0_9SPHN|nr:MULTISPECIES: GNAT family N-acetyltransferase [Novosphingobium]CDO37340.1 GCN5-related N-acetyltransferase [Novosphingobium sp. KN65.2]SLK07044.1 Protein N-acetyltransferase, RimJ/RimL family [Novosphingobium mathurense]